jgi:hypothetical protein
MKSKGKAPDPSGEGTNLWLPAFWLLCNCKNGISSYELALFQGHFTKSQYKRMKYFLYMFRIDQYGQTEWGYGDCQ